VLRDGLSRCPFSFTDLNLEEQGSNADEPSAMDTSDTDHDEVGEDGD
jgi:hypothetical protein